jgi:hypothetical protein
MSHSPNNAAPASVDVPSGVIAERTNECGAEEYRSGEGSGGGAAPARTARRRQVRARTRSASESAASGTPGTTSVGCSLIESWFSKLKERLVWRSEFETLEEARAAVAAYIETYHHRPRSGLDYRTPKEVRQTREDAQESEASTKSRGLG